MKATKYIGLTLVLAGFAIMLSTFFLDTYQVTDQTVAELEKKILPTDQNDQGYQKAKLYLQSLESIKGKQFSKWGIIPVLKQKLVDVNQQVDELNAEIKVYNDGLKDESQKKSEWWKEDVTGYGGDEIRLHTMSFAMNGIVGENIRMLFGLILGLMCFGGLLYFAPLAKGPAGIRNNHLFQKPMTKKWGWLAIVLGAFLFLLYCAIYWYPYLIVNWIKLADPVSYSLKGINADRWFWYGFIYTVLVILMGVRYAFKYRHSAYQLIRTASVTFFQVCFAFTIPIILESLHLPSEDLKNAWPLDYDFFFDYNLNAKLQAGTLGIFLLVWGIVFSLIGIPIFTYFFGKRWYCSWVCGCGGLAETAGDPWRQVSDKSTRAWKFERISIYSILIFAVVMTLVVILDYLFHFLGGFAYEMRKMYSLLVGSVLAGVIGTGLYPVLGNRPWCRFFCPLAAILGIVQRFRSRFRITVNGGQCISCGNCSTYCEMGIDVKAYAQRGENIVRASCVGCGVCSAVCPRGVLNLEAGPEDDRFTGGKPLGITKEEVVANFNE